MVITILQLKAAPEKRLNIIKTINAMIGRCLHCELFGSTQNDDKLVLLEKWESQETLNQHIKSEEFRKVLAAMDTACEPPEINFYEVDSLAGMDLVEKVLGAKV
jgi:quinol monooxygenase YgiN